jgi:hypothetical protein
MNLLANHMWSDLGATATNYGNTRIWEIGAEIRTHNSHHEDGHYLSLITETFARKGISLDLSPDRGRGLILIGGCNGGDHV